MSNCGSEVVQREKDNCVLGNREPAMSVLSMPSTEVNANVFDHRVLTDWSEVGINRTNGSNAELQLSIDMVFNDGHRLSITVYR